MALIVQENPKLSPVSGWRVADYGTEFGFIAHSIIRKDDGEYVDVTPLDPNSPPWKYPFLIDELYEYWEAQVFTLTLPLRMLKHPAPGRSRDEIEQIFRKNEEELSRYLSGSSR